MVVKTITINGKTYVPEEFSYNTICDLQELGVDIDKFDINGASMNRSFLAIWSGMSLKEAGNEIAQHVINGGNLDELTKAISDSMENSDFFHALNKTAEKETPKITAKKKETEN